MGATPPRFGFEQQIDVEVPNVGTNTYQLGEHTVRAGDNEIHIDGPAAFYGVLSAHVRDEEHTDDSPSIVVEPGTYRVGIDPSGPQ